ncbi:hypothetical protein CIPAW_13G013800 [Carya illinoinensis]|uniref:Uncharacterized protein n=1 Tax=Carya illinoinensis TaxID=32201 RepID=A0A8T1NN85_CARIL|nr:hypothetical protein CIPAW_13G013800 [Carya illinoinensis]
MEKCSWETPFLPFLCKRRKVWTFSGSVLELVAVAVASRSKPLSLSLSLSLCISTNFSC